MRRLMAQDHRGGLIASTKLATSSGATAASGRLPRLAVVAQNGLSEEISFLVELPDEAVHGPGLAHGAEFAPAAHWGGSCRVPALGARRLLDGNLAPAGSAVPNTTSSGRVGTQRCRLGAATSQLLMVPTAQQPWSPHATPAPGRAARD